MEEGPFMGVLVNDLDEGAKVLGKVLGLGKLGFLEFLDELVEGQVMRDNFRRAEGEDE